MPQHLQQQISAIQNKIVCSMVPDSIRSQQKLNISQLYKHCNILSINDLYTYRFILRYYFESEYKTVVNHPANTRLRLLNNFEIPSYKNKHGKRMLSFSIPNTFNNLPVSLRNLKNFNELKRLLKLWLHLGLNSMWVCNTIAHLIKSLLFTIDSDIFLLYFVYMLPIWLYGHV